MEKRVKEGSVLTLAPFKQTCIKISQKILNENLKIV
jgi:hypothetical protein